MHMGIYTITGLFGIGADEIIAGGQKAKGIITMANPCWWLKVNKKAVRLFSNDGAVFPHIITFEYEVDGKHYTGKHYVSWNVRCPVEGSAIAVYYDRTNPAKYAVKL
jgi:hypothetical protein